VLTLYGAICRTGTNTIIKQVAQRQMALENKFSWFDQVKQLCHKYHINNYLALEAPWRKKTWNELVTTTIKGYWVKKLLEGLQPRALSNSSTSPMH
jgi:hypothetical protein